MNTRRGLVCHPSLVVAAGVSVGLAATLLPLPGRANLPVTVCRRPASPSMLQSGAEAFRWESVAVPRYGLVTAEGEEVSLYELPGREMKREELRRVEWRGVNLEGVTFTSCDLREANLEGTNLKGASFWESDLRGARLDGADLRGVYFDLWTKWPAGFDPVARGAVLDD